MGLQPIVFIFLLFYFIYILSIYGKYVNILYTYTYLHHSCLILLLFFRISVFNIWMPHHQVYSSTVSSHSMASHSLTTKVTAQFWEAFTLSFLYIVTSVCVDQEIMYVCKTRRWDYKIYSPLEENDSYRMFSLYHRF